MDPETLTYDEWDALLIEEWMQADPGAPLPASSREGEIEWAHQNHAAWELVDTSKLHGLSKVEAQQRMAAQEVARAFQPMSARAFDALVTDERLQDRARRVLSDIDDFSDLDGHVDHDTFALITALDELERENARAWNEALHPRGPGGRFRSMVDRLKEAITVHLEGGGEGHPFEKFNREQLRRVARARGITLKRGAPRDEIAKLLLDDLSAKTTIGKHRALAPGEGWVSTKTHEGRRFIEKGGAIFAVHDPLVTDAQMQPILVMADRLLADNPIPHGGTLAVSVVDHKMMDTLKPPKPGELQSSVDGFTFLGTGYITILSETLTRGVQKTHGFQIPAGDRVTRGEYVLAHEWGHSLDIRTDVYLKIDAANHPAKNSVYGATDEYERYAESFAEFYLSGGKTPLLSPREDAKIYGWTVTS